MNINEKQNVIKEQPFFCPALNKVVSFSVLPKRIISLVPSQTELLYDLGLDDEVVGITKFCIHPNEWFKNKVRIGGTKDVNIEKIKLLNPDLIIANKEENVKEQIEALEAIAPVWVTDVNNLDDAVEMIEMIGLLVGRSKESLVVSRKIEQTFSMLPTNNYPLKTCCYLIWREPYITIGGDTFINDMLQRCGLINVFENETRYPTITIEEIKNSKCELVLLSSEPYPFKQKHIDELKLQMTNSKFLLVDGEMFSWYGSRLLHAVDYFRELMASL